jgi:hypothetical protein
LSGPYFHHRKKVNSRSLFLTLTCCACLDHMGGSHAEVYDLNLITFFADVYCKVIKLTCALGGAFPLWRRKYGSIGPSRRKGVKIWARSIRSLLGIWAQRWSTGRSWRPFHVYVRAALKPESCGTKPQTAQKAMDLLHSGKSSPTSYHVKRFCFER